MNKKARRGAIVKRADCAEHRIKFHGSKHYSYIRDGPLQRDEMLAISEYLIGPSDAETRTEAIEQVLGFCRQAGYYDPESDGGTEGDDFQPVTYSLTDQQLAAIFLAVVRHGGDDE